MCTGCRVSIVFAAMIVIHWIEHQTGWSIEKFVRTADKGHSSAAQGW
jgi:hypothetical protein